MDEQKYKEKLNQIYTERMIVVRMLSIQSGCDYGLGRDDNEDWEDEWRNVVYIDLPEGQVSWHIAKENMHIFADFPQYQGKWDGKFSGRDAEFAKSMIGKCTMYIEDKIRERNYRNIGWAIMHMDYFQRLWWSFTGKGKYMQRSFWKNKSDSDDKNKSFIEEISDLAMQAPELNMNNYDHDDVESLNDSMINICGIVIDYKNKFS